MLSVLFWLQILDRGWGRGKREVKWRFWNSEVLLFHSNAFWQILANCKLPEFLPSFEKIFSSYQKDIRKCHLSKAWLWFLDAASRLPSHTKFLASMQTRILLAYKRKLVENGQKNLCITAFNAFWNQKAININNQSLYFNGGFKQLNCTPWFIQTFMRS